MCGILGWAGNGKAPFEAAHFTSALNLLRHRGPDDEGVWSAPGVMLGHRRLSIIDLSAAGHQPMTTVDGAQTIVYNGEIYNYVELRAQLGAIGRTVGGGSDTGVLLEALVEWGVGALGRLNGMWAFGLWDASRRRLLLCRDRFGVKPLYYRHGPGGFAFASEPKALLALFPEHRAVNEVTLLRFLANNELYSHGESFYAGIHVLPPAHYAFYEPATDRLTLSRYWQYPERDDATGDSLVQCEQFAELFEDAVRLRLRSDVQVGITLSGGLDSTAVLTAASRRGHRAPHCFTSVYGDGSGELGWAQRAAAAVGAELEAAPAPQDGWLETLPDIAWHMDGPGYSPAVYPLWCLMRQARKANVPVLLEGQGADEALGGYPAYSVLEMIDFARDRGSERRSLAGTARRLRKLSGTFSMLWLLLWTGRELSPSLLAWRRSQVGFQSLIRPGVPLPPPLAADDMPPAGDSVRRRLIVDHSRTILPGLLQYGDAISMAHSIESRTPFMDYRLVEWMFRLPTAFKLRDGETKWVLREYLRSTGQASIGNRPDKRGYPTPVAKWLVSDPADLERRMLEGRSPLAAWCDPQQVRRLVEQVACGVAGADHHLYKLLAVSSWYERCIESRLGTT
jgi:asparagine synthase (glutamine-hydrolysing)